MTQKKKSPIKTQNKRSKTTVAKLPSTRAIQKAITQAADQLERARTQAAESKQPRFQIDPKSINDFFQKIYGFAKEAIFSEPAYKPDSRARDAWLATAVTKEPYLLGILQSVVSIDKNRGWTLIGGRNQVRRFQAILHNFGVAPDVYGWRDGASVAARNYYQSDLGAVIEVGRSMINGPLAGLFTVDPTQCVLTGNLEKPLKYTKAKKADQFWLPNDYFRVASFISAQEKMNGLGFCAVSRCIELAKLMVSVYEHEKEKLGSKAPKGLMTLNGVSQKQWLESMTQSDDERAIMNREYFSGIQVIANGDGGPDISVDLTILSGLPENFDRDQFVSHIIYGYALAFGYDPREFWPVSAGQLGSATETDSQHRRATSKGGLDFALNFQEKLQEELPPTIEFEFEQRDVAGDLAEAEYQRAVLEVIRGMYESVNAQNKNLIEYDEARQLMVTAGLIPDDWTSADEPEQITDTEDSGTEALLEKQRVQDAIKRFPLEDIVEFNNRTGKTRVLYSPNSEKPFMIRVIKDRPTQLPEPKINVEAFMRP